LTLLKTSIEMKRNIFIGIIVVFSLIASWKIYKNYRNKILSVSDHLNEISGIEYDKNGNLWAINDGGNSPQIHHIDSLGNISRSIRITNAKNVDWEDMTQDDFGHFFIGDFGNNLNIRSNLTIYKIENPIDIKGDSTKAEIIKFKFNDQDIDDKLERDMNFDLEAFISYKGKLYLFTKNRTKPFDGYTNLYEIGEFASNQNAKLIDKFKTCTSDKYLCWITSAALSPDKMKLALLGSDKMWIFKNWTDNDFFSGEVQEIDLGMVTQKEAITFLNDSIVILADEKFKGIGGNLYYHKLKQ